MKNYFNTENINSVLITGADGFIGSNLVDYLVSQDVKVKCLVYFDTQINWIKNQGKNIEIIKGDILDLDSLYTIVQGVDIVFHLAGIVKSLHKKKFFDVNVKGTENLLKAIVKTNPDLSRFLFMSSQAAAGPSCNGDALTEEKVCNPVSIYGRSKQEAEKVVLSYQPTIPVTIIRPAAVYGPRDKDFLFVFDLINRGIMPFLGFKERFLNFCYVDDLIKAAVLASLHNNSRGQTYFIHSDQKVSLNQFIRTIVQGFQKRVVKLPVPFSLFKIYFLCNEFYADLLGDDAVFTRDKYKELSQPNWLCSIEKAKTEIGYKPDFILEQGISHSIEWYKKQGWI